MSSPIPKQRRTVKKPPKRKIDGRNEESFLPDLRSRQCSIRTLLEYDFFLEKILSHLVGESISECRRVCKRWYKVCSELPIKTADRVPLDSIPDLFRSFPNVKELHANQNGGGSDKETILSSLKLFKQLQTFSFLVLRCLRRDDWKDQLLDSLSWIPSLEIKLNWNVSSEPNHLPSIHHLTNLTFLDLKNISLNKFRDQNPFVALPKFRNFIYLLTCFGMMKENSCSLP